MGKIEVIDDKSQKRALGELQGTAIETYMVGAYLGKGSVGWHS